MTLPSLATIDDIQELAPDLAGDLDETQAERLLTLASAIVRKAANRTWMNEAGDALEGVPDGVPELVALMVIRALRAPSDVNQERIGNYQVSYANAADRIYLTKAEKQLLRGDGSRAFTISLGGCS
jgi:hypothetical protein